MSGGPHKRKFHYRPGDVEKLLEAVAALGPSLFDPNSTVPRIRTWTKVAAVFTRSAGLTERPHVPSMRRKVEALLEDWLTYRMNRYLRQPVTPRRRTDQSRLLDHICFLRGDLVEGPNGQLQLPKSVIQSRAQDCLLPSPGLVDIVRNDITLNHRQFQDKKGSIKLDNGSTDQAFSAALIGPQDKNGKKVDNGGSVEQVFSAAFVETRDETGDKENEGSKPGNKQGNCGTDHPISAPLIDAQDKSDSKVRKEYLKYVEELDRVKTALRAAHLQHDKAKLRRLISELPLATESPPAQLREPPVANSEGPGKSNLGRHCPRSVYRRDNFAPDILTTSMEKDLLSPCEQIDPSPIEKKDLDDQGHDLTGLETPKDTATHHKKLQLRDSRELDWSLVLKRTE